MSHVHGCSDLKTLSVDTLLDSLCFGSVNREMVLFCGGFWVSVASLFFAMLGFFNSLLFRFRDPNNSFVTVGSDFVPEGTKSDVHDFLSPRVSVSEEEEEEEEEEETHFFSRFQFRSYEEFITSNAETNESITVPDYDFDFDSEEKLSDFGFDFDSEEKLSDFDFDFDSEEKLSDFDSDSIASSHDFPVLDQKIDSNNNACSSDVDYENTDMDDELGSGKCRVEDCDDDDDDDDDSKGYESLWEHQELIEQLKKELKRVRATGLPTIPEESEYPKATEDLKQWKIDEKIDRRDMIRELHKFHESYRERMRKFDVLCYQKTCAIGFLQSKQQSDPVVGSLLQESFRLCKPKKPKPDIMYEFTLDLETVYVGQLCLSWEFLHWQYEKTLQLYESDPHGMYTYNRVAGEFQQFQVSIQRFMEDERFEGPRVNNYVKNRRGSRNFLQVPVLREDKYKERTKRRVDAVTCDMVVEIMEESIRLFWQFVRAEKDLCNGIRVVGRETHSQIQHPADEALLLAIQEDHHKKERKVKEMVRSGKCIMKRLFRVHQEDSSEQVLHFFSQVDLKIVARVLKMSTITNHQLLWCQAKLSKFSFVNTKISVDTSFLLFPC